MALAVKNFDKRVRAKSTTIYSKYFNRIR